ADELVQPVLDVEAALDTALEESAPFGWEAAAGGGDADDGGGRAERQRVFDRAHDPDPVLRLAGACRVDERDDGRQAVADAPARRLAVVRVAGEVLGQDEVALAGHYLPAACSTAWARSVSSSWAAVPQSTASTPLPFEPGRFHQRRSQRHVPS